MKQLIEKAKAGDGESIQTFLNLFDQFMIKNSYINGCFNDDCYQELRIRLIECIKRFQYDEVDNIIKTINLYEIPLDTKFLS